MANEDKSARYHRLHRRATILGAALTTVFLVLLFLTGGAAAFRDLVLEFTGSAFLPAVAAYTGGLVLAHDLMLAPLAYYRGVLESAERDVLPAVPQPNACVCPELG